MNIRRPYILALNAGSSSIKFVVHTVAQNGASNRVFEGEITGIGLNEGNLTVQNAAGAKIVERRSDTTDHVVAMRQVITWLREHVPDEGLAAIGHRIVHGGPYFYESCLITDDTLKTLSGLTIFDPLHLPNELDLIKTCKKEFANVPQIACFDTAFHHDMPEVARRMALPREYEEKGLRRYGFHGLSCAYIMGELTKVDPTAVAGRVIIAHLGSGVSLTAVKNGLSQDTTMALTPAAGIPMSTRSGDIDPGIVRYLAHAEGLNAEEFDEMINKRSGLLGISETTPDMEELLRREAEDDRAKNAVELFCYAVKKQIGALAAGMGGCDTIVFTGGMGENAPKIRARVTEGLEFLGVQLDTRRNNQNKPVISPDGSRVTVRMLHTDENQVIVQEIMKIQGEIG